jgi:hypothetical protein
VLAELKELAQRVRLATERQEAVLDDLEQVAKSRRS